MQKSSITYILKLSIPIFFANLAIPLVGIIDTSLMGNLGNLSYLTATSIAANLFSMIFWSFGFLRMGTVGMVSQALGQNNYQEILNIILRNLLFVLMVSVLIFISQFFILNSQLKKPCLQQQKNIRIHSKPRCVSSSISSFTHSIRTKRSLCVSLSPTHLMRLRK